MSEGPKLYANKPKKSQLKPPGSSSMGTDAAQYKPAPPPPPPPPKESFARRYKFVWPLLLAVNFSIGAYLFMRTKKKDTVTEDDVAETIPSSAAKSHESSSETPESVAMRKSKSTPGDIDLMDRVDAGYVSDGPEVQERKKGVPWTEEEHKKFLNGLQNLGKGDWKGISKNYVHSRTATQVASHAQKHFKRKNLPDKRNRRHSVFDMTLNEPQISNSTPPEPPDNTKEKVPRLVDNMHALKMNQKVVNEEQVDDMLALNMSPKIINVEQADIYARAAPTPLPAAPVLPYAPCYGVPNLNQNPYFPMMGMANNGQIYFMGKSLSGLPSTPMMYIPNAAFSCIQKPPGSQAPTSFFMPNFAHGSSSTTARP